MRILTFNVPTDYDLILFGDNQEGNALSSRDGYLECLDFIMAEKNRFALHMGDEMEGYWIDDPRYDPQILLSNPLAQQDQVIADLMPLAKAKKLITILYGNHSHRLYQKVGDVTESTCNRLGIPYGGFSCIVEFRDKKGIQFKGFFTHGRRGLSSVADDPVRREANMRLQLKRHLENKAGDCLLMAKGHSHKLLVCEPTPRLYLVSTGSEVKQKYTHHQMADREGYIHPDHRWYASTGSFLKTYGMKRTGYAELFEYDPVELGFIVVEVRDRQIESVRKKVV